MFIYGCKFSLTQYKFKGSSNTTTDIETCNLEEFGKNVHIERLKYLWRGKGAPEQTYWSFHGSRDFGIELGKSFLRGVSGRTVISQNI